MPAWNPHPQKKPPLTHFLCLPLLTPTSTPQLQASLAHLKSVIEALQPATEGANVTAGAQTRPPRSRPLVPPAAFRPLGTLHLTLGVMSLKEPARLRGALQLLEDLDLEALLSGVSVGKSSPENMVVGESPLPPLGRGRATEKSPDRLEEESSISQNMMGLAARTIDTPAAQATEGEATTTTTLKTLCKPISPPPISNPSSEPPLPNSSPPAPLTISLHTLSPFPAQNPTHATVLHTAPDDPTQRLQPFCHSLLTPFQTAGYILPDPPERELTLHATLINTVYAKKKRRDGEGKRAGKVTFDATPIMRVFNEGGGGELSSSPPRTGIGSHADNINNGAFTFASAIAINRVQICEMGAKKLDPECDLQGLGERYVVVAEKRILDPALVSE